MSICHVLRFVVYNHTIRLIDIIICDIKYITNFFTTICKFSQPRNTRRDNIEVICVHQLHQVVNEGASINTPNLKLGKSSMYTLKRWRES